MNEFDADQIAALLAPGSTGGTVDLPTPADPQQLSLLAATSGARFVLLSRPADKQELLTQIAAGLDLPEWFGTNWDALEEVLGAPEPAHAGPLLIVWIDPDQLDAADPIAGRTFRAIVWEAGARRTERGHGAIVLAVAQTEQTFENLLVWMVNATEGIDSAWVSVARDRLTARGEISAESPEPYSVRYTLETGESYATLTLRAEVATFLGTRQIELRQEQGRWLVNGMPRRDLDGALDCDIYACPLTNTMPILRHELHRRPGEVSFSMAFVQLPELAVVRSDQTYTHLRLRDDGGAVVRYSSGDFHSDLVVDADGFVVTYPGLGAIRISPE